MTDRLGFTMPALARLRPREKRFYVYDARCPGLALSVLPTGGKVFFRIGRIHGQPQRIRIGSYPGLSVGQARKAAIKLSGEISQGKDPQAERRRQRQAVSLGDAWNHYRDTHLAEHSSPKSLAEDIRRFNKHLSRWGRRPIGKITPAEVGALHARLGKNHGKTESNRVIALFKRVFNHACRQLAVEARNPCERIRPFKEQSRARFLNADELRRLFKALWHPDENADVRDFVLTCLYSGARKGNVEGMKWADVDLTRGLWTICPAESKNRQPLVVILPGPAVRLLEARTRYGEFVFRGPGGHLPDIRKRWHAIRARAGLADVTLHDLRRTMASWQVATGASLPVVGKSLGHKSQAATAIYARLDHEGVRASVEQATTAMLEAGNGKVV